MFGIPETINTLGKMAILQYFFSTNKNLFSEP